MPVSHDQSTIDVYVLDVTASNGTPFRVLAIPAHAAGPNPHRTPADHGYASVEFFDRRHPNAHDGEHGQFTGGCYRLDEMLDHRPPYGLNLHGGEPAWHLDPAAFGVVHGWLTILHERGLITRADDEPAGAPGGKVYDHRARPDDDPEPGDRCKQCGEDITWLGPSPYDWLHVDDVDNS